MIIKYRVALVGIGADDIGTAVVDNEEQAKYLVNGTPKSLAIFGRFIQWITPWTEYDTREIKFNEGRLMYIFYHYYNKLLFIIAHWAISHVKIKP